MDCSETIGDRNGPCTLQRGESPKDDRRYIMYHGTDVQGAHGILAQGFRRSARGMLGPGVYVSRDIEKARRYPIGKPENVKVILKLRVNVGRVKKIDGQGHPLRLTWHDEGYDTAWVPRGCGMVTSELEEDCVWDPERITVVGVEEAPSSEMKTMLLAMMKNPNDAVQIVVKDLEGKSLRLMVKLSESVLALKVRIQSKWKVSPAQQRLAYGGTALQDATTLANCGLMQNATVYLLHVEHAVDVFVKTLANKTLTIEVKLSDSVLSLKQKVQQKAGIPIDQQMLTFGSHTLEDDQKLERYGIQQHSTIKCGLKQNATVNLLHVDHAVDVFVKTLTNKTLTIEVKLSDSVLSLKQKIQDKAGIPVKQQILTFSTYTLEDDQKLEGYGIQQHSTITMQIQLRGG